MQKLISSLTIHSNFFKKTLLVTAVATVLSAGLLFVWRPVLFAGESEEDKPPTELVLTEEEQQWVREHPVVRFAPDVDFAPIEYLDQQERHQGIAADYLALLVDKLPFRLEMVQIKKWTEVMRQAKSREIDMLSAAAPTPERLEFLRFTNHYVTFPAVLLIRDDKKISPTISNLEGLRVAAVSGYADHEYMIRVHPKVALDAVPDISSGLRLVAFGKVDAMILNLASASYYIKKDGITNLQVYKDSGFIYDFSFAVRKDWPQLVSILNKAIATIPLEGHQEIFAKWVGLKQQPWRPSKEAILLFGAVVISITLAGVVLWNRSLRQRIAARTSELQKELADRIRAEEEGKELRQKINQAKKMEALGLLAGGVAHDLNNILSGIVGYPELLLFKLQPDHPMYVPLTKIKESGVRAAAVVADMLTIARGAASTKDVSNLNVIVTEYLQSPEHEEKHSRFPTASIIPQLDENLLNIRCSSVHLRKCLMNLVLNALEALPPQEGIIIISTTNRYLDRPLSGYDTIQAGEYVLLTVQDNGAGIDPKDIEHIFEPFYSKKILGRSGTGLGLAVVWNTIQEHEGYINVSSSAAGTVFDLYFPACREVALIEQEGMRRENLRGNKEKILVIDDEPVQRDIATRMLNALNYQAFCVESGEEALIFLEKNQVVLLVLDMIMGPGINGLETYERIVARHPGQKAIIASGFSENEDVRKTQALGAGQYLKKPYTLEKLGQAVKKELQG